MAKKKELGGTWRKLFPPGISSCGNIKNLFIVIFGPPGAGKSTLTMKLCDQWPESAIYMKPSTFEHIIKDANKYDLVGIDGLQIADREIGPLRQTFINMGTTLILTSQTTKDNKTIGNIRLACVADVLIELLCDHDFGKFVIHKCRLGGLRKGEWTRKHIYVVKRRKRWS